MRAGVFKRSDGGTTRGWLGSGTNKYGLGADDGGTKKMQQPVREIQPTMEVRQGEFTPLLSLFDGE
jgi:hypothetical protein